MIYSKVTGYLVTFFSPIKRTPFGKRSNIWEVAGNQHFQNISICTKDNDKSCPILQSFNLSKGGEIITSGIM
jgi:hypothetical protein